MHPPDALPPGATPLEGMLEDMLRRRYLVVDGQGRISRWSVGAESLLGWREEEVVGRSAFGQPLAWAGEGVELWRTYFDAPQAGRPPARAHLQMLCRGGWGLSVEMTAVPVPLVLGYEFTMLVADLAVGGPGSQSQERLAQVHPLAADAIASALNEDAPIGDSVAGLLVSLRAVSDTAVIEDPDAQHAARALAIERDEHPRAVPAEELPPVGEDDHTAEDLAEAHESLKAASAEVTRLRDEIGRLRGELVEQEKCAEQARTEAGRLSAALDQAATETKLAAAAADEARAELAELSTSDEAAAEAQAEELADSEHRREELTATLDAKAAELEQSERRREELTAALDAKAAELEESECQRNELVAAQQRTRADMDKALADHKAAAGRLEELNAEHDRLRAELDEVVAAREELQRELDEARAALAEATRERDSIGAAESETDEEREALRAELERAALRCEELSAALDTKTAELQALPPKPAIEAAKKDRDEARSALAAALAERDRAAEALEAAAGDRDRADAALRQAEAERDQARSVLAEVASENEAAHAAVASQEQHAEGLRRKLEEAERAAAERSVEVQAATREAAEQRDRVAAGHLETEALAHERARVSELQAQITALTGELEGALARAAEHAPEQPLASEPATAPRDRSFEPGLDDNHSPRAYIGLDGRFTALNDGFCRLVGYSESEFSGAYWPPVIDADNRNDLRRATARLIAGELSGWDVDTIYMAGNGTLVRVVGTLRVARSESGSAQHLVLDAQPLSAVAAR
jgi:PAS domain S-box-containing protein